MNNNFSWQSGSHSKIMIWAESNQWEEVFASATMDSQAITRVGQVSSLIVSPMCSSCTLYSTKIGININSHQSKFYFSTCGLHSNQVLKCSSATAPSEARLQKWFHFFFFAGAITNSSNQKRGRCKQSLLVRVNEKWLTGNERTIKSI